jgi:hypothetical protein
MSALSKLVDESFLQMELSFSQDLQSLSRSVNRPLVVNADYENQETPPK